MNRSDMTAVIPDLIVLAEVEMNTTLRVRQMVASTTLSLTTEFVALPSDFAGPISMTLSTGQVMDWLFPDQLAQQKYADGVAANTPTACAIVGSNLQFEPAPSGALSGTLLYHQKIPAFSIAPNWVSQNFINAYLWGALTVSAPYLQDDTRVAVWGSLFTEAMEKIEAASLKEAIGSSPRPSTLLVI